MLYVKRWRFVRKGRRLETHLTVTVAGYKLVQRTVAGPSLLSELTAKGQRVTMLLNIERMVPLECHSSKLTNITQILPSYCEG